MGRGRSVAQSLERVEWVGDDGTPTDPLVRVRYTLEAPHLLVIRTRAVYSVALHHWMVARVVLPGCTCPLPFSELDDTPRRSGWVCLGRFTQDTNVDPNRHFSVFAHARLCPLGGWREHGLLVERLHCLGSDDLRDLQPGEWAAGAPPEYPYGRRGRLALLAHDEVFAITDNEPSGFFPYT